MISLASFLMPVILMTPTEERKMSELKTKTETLTCPFHDLFLFLCLYRVCHHSQDDLCGTYPQSGP